MRVAPIRPFELGEMGRDLAGLRHEPRDPGFKVGALALKTTPRGAGLRQCTGLLASGSAPPRQGW